LLKSPEKSMKGLLSSKSKRGEEDDYISSFFKYVLDFYFVERALDAIVKADSTTSHKLLTKQN